MRSLTGRTWGEIERGPKIGLTKRTTFVIWFAENKLSKENTKDYSEK